MYNLFLDDFRNPIDVIYYINNPIYINEKWVVVRNYDEFIFYITKNGLPNIVSFDHDLADIHYKNQKNIDYSQYEEKTGYHCVKWLVNYCIDNNLEFPEWYIHSMNIIGSKNMESYIKNYLKFKKEN